MIISKFNYYGSFFNREFNSLYKICKPHMGTSWTRQYALYIAIKEIIKNKIPGDFVECGVWKGGSALFMALMLEKYEPNSKRKIWLYDTYTGMTQPNEFDIKFNGANAIKIYNEKKKEGYVDWVYSSLEDVKKVMSLSKYKNLEFIKGDVLETIPKIAPKKIALLRLDTDFYESTKHELEHLYPRLQKKGYLIIDDYNSWKGATKAVDDYFSSSDVQFETIRKTGLIGVKNE